MAESSPALQHYSMKLALLHCNTAVRNLRSCIATLQYESCAPVLQHCNMKLALTCSQLGMRTRGGVTQVEHLQLMVRKEHDRLNLTHKVCRQECKIAPLPD